MTTETPRRGLDDDTAAGLNALLAETVSPAALRRSCRLGQGIAAVLGSVFGGIGLGGAVLTLLGGLGPLALLPILFGGFGVWIAVELYHQQGRVLRRLDSPPPAEG